MTRSIFAAAAALFLGACQLGSDADAAASTVRSSVVLMGNKGPLYERDDGLGLDVDNNGPGLVVNGEIDQMFNSSLYVGVEEDFLGWFLIPDMDTTDLAQGTWAQQNAGTTNVPARSADYDNGALALLLSNTSEVGSAAVHWANELNIDSDTEPFCIFRLQYVTAPAAADKLSWGLANNHNAIHSSTTNHASFSVAGADNNLDAESDDNTTDVNATDTTVDMVAGTFIETMVSLNSMHGRTADDGDGCSATDVGFFTRTSTGGAWTQRLAGTAFTIGADVALQPFVQIEKTSGTSVPDLLIDRISCYWQRE